MSIFSSDLFYFTVGFSSCFFLRHLVLNKMAMDEVDIQLDKYSNCHVMGKKRLVELTRRKGKMSCIIP